eukprot:jgi/Ulvmu1/10538/UM064_0076.1
MLAAASKAGDHRAALQMWHDLRRGDIAPDITCCAVFVCAASQAGSTEELEEAAKLVTQVHGSPRQVAQVVHAADALLLALACHGAPDTTIDVFQGPVEGGLTVHPSSVSQCVQRLAQREAWTQLLLLLRAAADAGYTLPPAPPARLQSGGRHTAG